MKKDSSIVTLIGAMIMVVSLGITLILSGIYPDQNWFAPGFRAMGIGAGIAIVGIFSPW